MSLLKQTKFQENDFSELLFQSFSDVAEEHVRIFVKRAGLQDRALACINLPIRGKLF